MTHGKVWPAHPKPLPEELLTSWIVRVAEANAIKLQTLSWMLFGNGRSPWNRDVDRSAPLWLVQALCQHTGTSDQLILDTTLLSYRSRLYSRSQISGQLRWILPIRSYGMQRKSFGLQFCPECLATDQIPYFRKPWRVALFTYCPEHRIALHDACPGCGIPVVTFRGDFGRELKDALPMYVCHACGYDFREAERKPVFLPSEEMHSLFDAMLQSLSKPGDEAGRFDLGFFAVMHQFCRVMGTRQNRGRLQDFLAEQLGLQNVPHQPGRIGIEQRRIGERHLLLLCALWLMADLQSRLRAAWSAKAIRYNLMLKDFDELPGWYREIVERFSNWRTSRISGAEH